MLCVCVWKNKPCLEKWRERWGSCKEESSKQRNKIHSSASTSLSRSLTSCPASLHPEISSLILLLLLLHLLLLLLLLFPLPTPHSSTLTSPPSPAPPPPPSHFGLLLRSPLFLLWTHPNHLSLVSSPDLLRCSVPLMSSFLILSSSSSPSLLPVLPPVFSSLTLPVSKPSKIVG